MSFQIAVRLPEDLMESLDALVAEGRFATRADAVRHAVVTLVAAEERRRVGAAIAEGYRRIPQSEAEMAAATNAAIRSIHEEPW